MKERQLQYTEDDAKLIPEIRDWNDGAGISIENWIMLNGRPDHAIGYTRIFWPRFILLEGGIFLEDGFSRSNFDSWMTECDGDIRSVQAVMNHRHPDLYFQIEGAKEISVEQEAYLARVLMDMWLAKAKLDFPDLEFEASVENCDNPDDYASVSIWVKSTTHNTPMQAKPDGAPDG